jgi:hypothetical protein
LGTGCSIGVASAAGGSAGSDEGLLAAGGGGAGGSIQIIADDIKGSGVVRANGGPSGEVKT